MGHIFKYLKSLKVELLCLSILTPDLCIKIRLHIVAGLDYKGLPMLHYVLICVIIAYTTPRLTPDLPIILKFDSDNGKNKCS